MATITFKTKLKQVYNMDDSLAYEYLDIPVFTRAHCDMGAFRNHPKYGGYANSDLFPGMLSRIRAQLFPHGMLKLSAIPEGVTVKPGFLHVVTITV